MNFKIQAFQTHYEIYEYDWNDNTQLQNMLSVWDSVTFSRKNLAVYYDEDKRILYVPRAISFQYLERAFDTDINIVDKPEKPDKVIFNMTTQPRDDDQRKIIAFLFGEMDFKYTIRYSQLAVNLKTGKGKTYCALAYASLIKDRTAIILNDNSVLQQWKEAIQEHTDISEDEICEISGGTSIKKLFKKDKLDYKIVLMSHATIRAHANKYEWSGVTDLFEHLRIGCKIFDETHKWFENINMIDFFTNVKKTVYLSYTLGRSDRGEDAVFNKCFSNIPTFGAELTTMDDIYIAGLILKCNTAPSIRDVAACKTKKGFSSVAYTDMMFGDTIRNKDFIETLYRAVDLSLGHDGKIAILVATLKAISKLKTMLEERYPDIEIGEFTSSISDKEVRRKELDKRIILSTSKSMSTAIDVPGLCYMIMTEPFSSVHNQKQICGRLRKIANTRQLYIEILNEGFSDMVSQYKKRRPVLQKLVLKLLEMKIKK